MTVTKSKSSAACAAPLASEVIVALQFITTAALAPALGKSDARAARDWCNQHGVPYRRDGKHNWVHIADVQRVLQRMPLHRPANCNDRSAAVDAALAVLTKRR